MLERNRFIYRLSENFYRDYPANRYGEILSKKNRPYNCIFLKYSQDLVIAIPYRSNISHKYAYMFRTSIRGGKYRSGLDYTKAVIISKKIYLDDSIVIIDNDEYKETVKNIERIRGEAIKFVNDYVKYMNGEVKLHKKEFERRYQYSPLIYFHQELNIGKGS